MTYDPTAYALGGDPTITDPRERRLNAWANFGGRYRLTMPFMTEVVPGLWHGGVETGLILPEFIQYKLSLYPWEDYEIHHELAGRLDAPMFDDPDQSLDLVEDLATWVNDARAMGPTLVHCQAGVNRSSLIIAAALLQAGDVTTGQKAIDLIRGRRDPACLRNPAFEAWVRERGRVDTAGRR
ncbi:dual specificity protein phosphatase [Microbacterium sp. 77mftsu3.1]|uniref:dual specificity protein phosphatase family protein n=1 Tax=Microbacterium sp. 77mftsu3.1 TaxID=1761802 RepID=UPI0003640D67|nr:dual specificity protein phosphatase family protein [Microbacterium sp. 77mftsu3.1]SDH40996.1 Protein-tyrosine phosphatase [Microbacterium sp. 77mftsu3.1]